MKLLCQTRVMETWNQDGRRDLNITRLVVVDLKDVEDHVDIGVRIGRKRRSSHHGNMLKNTIRDRD